MRAIVQRVASARVRVGDRVIGEIGHGLLVFIGVGREDGFDDVKAVARKICEMRVFEGDGKPMDRSIVDAGGSLLVVSQFTLYGDMRKGRRPSFDAAAPPDRARAVYEELVRELRATTTVPVITGEFQAMMQVELVNDGPVTILIDSKKQF